MVLNLLKFEMFEETSKVHQAGIGHVRLELRKEALARERNLGAIGLGAKFKATG